METVSTNAPLLIGEVEVDEDLDLAGPALRAVTRTAGILVG
jgi:hypothetical protein